MHTLSLIKPLWAFPICQGYAQWWFDSLLGGSGKFNSSSLSSRIIFCSWEQGYSSHIPTLTSATSKTFCRWEAPCCLAAKALSPLFSPKPCSNFQLEQIGKKRKKKGRKNWLGINKLISPLLWKLQTSWIFLSWQVIAMKKPIRILSLQPRKYIIWKSFPYWKLKWREKSY